MKLLSHFANYQKKKYPTITNWKNHVIGDRILYSCRDTIYERCTYPSNLHYHDYYELVIFEKGDIRYVCEGRVYYPKYGDIILIPPGKFHMSLISGEATHYKRYVFYLYENAFDFIGSGALANFLRSAKTGDMLSLASFEDKKRLIGYLEKLNDLLNTEATELERVLSLSYVIRIFYLLNKGGYNTKTESSLLPENVFKIQEYIDENFADISSVSQIAEHFFYSREYVSRLFKKHFDTTISDYIMKRRVEKSQELIVQGVPMIEISNMVGFGSLSTFIRAFRLVTDMTPSEYKKIKKLDLV